MGNHWKPSLVVLGFWMIILRSLQALCIVGKQELGKHAHWILMADICQPLRRAWIPKVQYVLHESSD